MKFNVFTFEELRYKVLVFLLVVVITIATVFAYLNVPKGTDTGFTSYVLSITYALLLFIVGLYITHMSSKKQNMFLKRKEQYKSLHQLLNLYETDAFKENYDEMYNVVFSQVLMRNAKPNGNSLISFKGYEQTEKYLNIEKEFLSTTKEINELLNKEVKNYVAAKKIKMKVKFLFIVDKTIFFKDVKKWAEEHLDLSDIETVEFVQFANNLPNAHNKIFKKMNKTSNKLKKERNIAHKKCKNNIRNIEEMYGDLLVESLKEEKELSSNFLFIQQLIQELKEELLKESSFESNMETYFYKIETILNRIDNRVISVEQEVEDINNYLYKDEI